MVAQKTVTRVDGLSNLVDASNALADRDKGLTWDLVIWTPDSPSYGLVLDNVQGNHANFGSGILLVQDSGITLGAGLALTGDITATGNLKWKSGTAFTGTLDHAMTADRTIAFQDLDGSVALLGTNAQNVGSLEFADATHDIGSNGHRPRDLTISRNAVIGGTLGATGAATLSGGGALSGTFTGAPVFSGTPDFSGAVTFSGLTWTTFSPSVTQSAALTMTVNYARYRVIGKVALVQIQMTYASGASVLGAQITITGLPAAIQPARTGNQALAGVFAVSDASPAAYYSGIAVTISSTTVAGFIHNSTTTIGVNPSMQLAANDIVCCNLSYEIA